MGFDDYKVVLYRQDDDPSVTLPLRGYFVGSLALSSSTQLSTTTMLAGVTA